MTSWTPGDDFPSETAAGIREGLEKLNGDMTADQVMAKIADQVAPHGTSDDTVPIDDTDDVDRKDKLIGGAAENDERHLCMVQDLRSALKNPKQLVGNYKFAHRMISEITPEPLSDQLDHGGWSTQTPLNIPSQVG